MYYTDEMDMTTEQLIADHLDKCANGTNLHNISWDWEKDEQVKTVNLVKPWFLVEYYMSENFANLHTHYEIYSSDCDGSYEYYGTTHATDIRGIEDEYDFKCHMIGSLVKTYNPTGALQVNEDESVTWTESNDEGGRSETISFCYDWSCDHKRSQRDHRAESMGY